MSRIGNAIIKLPEGVAVDVSADNLVTVKGPLGELSTQVGNTISVKVEDNVVTLSRASESKSDKSLHGLYRSLVNNMVNGVTVGFKKELELVGVGYKAQAKGQLLELTLGYSHNVTIQLPSEIKFETSQERGKSPRINLSSSDKQLLGQVVAKIISLRKPEPYKGKGIKEVGKYYRRKAGKTAAKTA